MGTSWRFQSFYVAFREQMATHLGMTDYLQLSLFSPMPQRRLVPAGQQQPSYYWTSQAPGFARSTKKRDSAERHDGRPTGGPTSTVAGGEGGSTEERQSAFRRTKATLAPVGSLVTRQP